MKILLSFGLIVFCLPLLGVQILSDEDLAEIQKRETHFRELVKFDKLEAGLISDLRKLGSVFGMHAPIDNVFEELKYANLENPIFTGEFWSVQVFEKEGRIEVFCYFNEETGEPRPYGEGDLEIRLIYKVNDGDEKALYSLSKVTLERGIDWVVIF